MEYNGGIFLNTHIAILGGGSWGTAFAKVCALAGLEVALFVRDQVIVQEINTSHQNSHYLPGIILPDKIKAYAFNPLYPLSYYTEVYDQIGLLFIGVPAQHVRECLRALGEIPSDLPIISLAKGIERGSALRMSEVIVEYYPQSQPGVLSGPNLALEVAGDMPTTAVLAIEKLSMHNTTRIQEFIEKLTKTHFSIQLSQDVIGVEIAGAMKNIVALACGMAAGLEFGENTLASLVTQGFQEISRFILALGGEQKTLFSPAGIGDLTATCYAKSSRNHSFGMEMARKYSSLQRLNPAIKHSRIAEVSALEVFTGYDSTVMNNGIEQVVEAIPTLDALALLAEKHYIRAPFLQIMQAIMAKLTPIEAGIRQLVALSMG